MSTIRALIDSRNRGCNNRLGMEFVASLLRLRQVSRDRVLSSMVQWDREGEEGKRGADASESKEERKGKISPAEDDERREKRGYTRYLRDDE